VILGDRCSAEDVVDNVGKERSRPRASPSDRDRQVHDFSGEFDLLERLLVRFSSGTSHDEDLFLRPLPRWPGLFHFSALAYIILSAVGGMILCFSIALRLRWVLLWLAY